MKNKGSSEIFKGKSCNRGSLSVARDHPSYFQLFGLDFSKSIAITLIKTTGREVKDANVQSEGKLQR